MRISAALLFPAILLTGASDSAEYRSALPGYSYSFPRDHFSHPEFRTEWWYYTGNLRSAEGRRFGYELTFFRHAVTPSLPAKSGVWDVRDVWMAHLALSDIDGQRFLNTERLNRSGAGLAGADAGSGVVWNGNWSVRWLLDPAFPADFREQQLRGVADGFSIHLTLHSAKPAIVHGKNGVSQKSAGAGRASHYISLTRLLTNGSITLDGKRYTVEGASWMDHEFFSHSMESNLSGWDWFSLQFDDGTELMLYRLRRKDGSTEPLSSGTYVDAAGKATYLSRGEFELQPRKTWTSPKTGAAYPVEWAVRVPAHGLGLFVRTPLSGQELAGKFGTSPSYWEGAIDVQGTRGGLPIRGVGYLEMTGYAEPVRMGE